MAKEKVLVVGTGWAGYAVSHGLDEKKFDVRVVSPQTSFPYTPLLASATCGLFDFSIAQEPIRSKTKNLAYYKATVESVDFEKKVARCKSAVGVGEEASYQEDFDVSYDRVVLTPGCVTNTFNTPGAAQNAYFLRNVPDAIRVQKRIKAQLEQASLPGMSAQQQRDLLHIIIIGGGPTGVEIAAELSDVFSQEFSKVYPHLADKLKISIHDAAGTILGPFEESLRKHSLESFSKRGVGITTNSKIKSVEQDCIVTEAEGRIPCGAVIWTAGNKQSPLVDALAVAKAPKMPRILTDDYLHVLAPDNSHSPMPEVFALGDAADIANHSLPTTAEVAVQKAEYLVRQLNNFADPWESREKFEYKQKPLVAYIGGHDGVVHGKQEWKGEEAWAAWRSKNLDWVRGWRRKVLILVSWGLDRIYGGAGVVSRFLGEK